VRRRSTTKLGGMWNFRQLNAFEQAELILQAALDPTIASRAKKGEFVTCFDHLGDFSKRISLITMLKPGGSGYPT
jgi:hypothetical protein